MRFQLNVRLITLSVNDSSNSRYRDKLAFHETDSFDDFENYLSSEGGTGRGETRGKVIGMVGGKAGKLPGRRPIRGPDYTGRMADEREGIFGIVTLPVVPVFLPGLLDRSPC